MRKGLLLWLVAGWAPWPAQAVLGIGETEFRVGVRDAATAQPLAEAFIVAREFKTVGKLHGSAASCIRADAAPSSGAWTVMRLPSPGADALSSTRAMEAWAYRPGYCLARTADGYRLSSSKHVPSSIGDRAKPLDPAADTTLTLHRAKQTPEERLLYLTEAAQGLLCQERWSSRGIGTLTGIEKAMLAEAGALPRDRYEKALLERLRAAVAMMKDPRPWGGQPEALGVQRLPAGHRPFAREFLLAPANARIGWPSGDRGIVTVAQGTSQLSAASPPPQLAAVSPPRSEARRAVSPYTPQAVRPSLQGVPIVAAQGGTAYGAARSAAAAPGAPGAVTVHRQQAPPGSTELAIHCRRGPRSACNLDERDARGETAVYQYVGNLKVKEAKLLLESGANPSVPVRPGGPNALDRLLAKMVQLDPAGAQAASAKELLALLAASPKMTIGAKLRADLTLDPSRWNSAQQAKGLPLIVAAREQLLALPVHDDAPGCEPLGWDRSIDERPFRLRYP